MDKSLLWQAFWALFEGPWVAQVSNALSFKLVIAADKLQHAIAGRYCGGGF
jgi:hypothetical protein